jgi:rhamnose utilization protein RhaD (predicted bifunctional aldolase and dehydrogenase)
MAQEASPPEDLDALRRVSARIGADPALTQGAGGNTSVKDAGTLWIKASGTWLAHALDAEIFVPVAIAPLLEAVRRVDPAAERAEQFVRPGPGASGLRPSIETTVHALMPQRVVLHVHCVNTIAHAVRADPQATLAPLLDGLNWALIPYARPGLPLALAIAEHAAGRPDVLILANHGLVVAAETVADAEHLLLEVSRRLHTPPRPSPPGDVARLGTLAASSGGAASYRLPASEASHGVAMDPVSLVVARCGSLYPDHVIFLGEGSVIAGPGEDVAAVVARNGLAPTSIVFPGAGVLMRSDATSGSDAMARCLADVAARIPADARLRALTPGEHRQLTNWDAEKYRQDLARKAQLAQQGA